MTDLSPRKPTAQQRVYDALAQQNVLDSRDVAFIAGLKREQVRIAISRLKAKGIIECVHRQPVYRITPGAQRPADLRGRKRA